MRVVGIIAEYNPFHTGHAWHLAEAKRQAGADYAVVALSTWWTQRGSPALLTSHDRARMALQSGADAVVALPAACAVRDAERYALAGVSLLHGLGCDALAFGAERADLPALQAVAHLLEDGLPSTAQETLRQNLAQGLGYPAALAQAVEATLPGAGLLLRQPNNTLAICYLRALHRLSSGMTPVPIQRLGAYHHTDPHQAHPSATALRGAFARGDWPALRQGMPAPAFDVLHEAALTGLVCNTQTLDTVTLAQLRLLPPQAWAALPDLSEGIENRLRHAVHQAATLAEALQLAQTPRYTRARLRRLCAAALLGLTSDTPETPPAALLLGARAEARPLLHHLGSGSLPLLGRSNILLEDTPCAQVERRSLSLWALGTAASPEALMRQRVVLLPAEGI